MDAEQLLCSKVMGIETKRGQLCTGLLLNNFAGSRMKFGVSHSLCFSFYCKFIINTRKYIYMHIHICVSM